MSAKHDEQLVLFHLKVSAPPLTPSDFGIDDPAVWQASCRAATPKVKSALDVKAVRRD